MTEIGGFEGLVDEAADDYEIGYRVAARGHRVELVEGTVKTWCCVESLGAFFIQRLRWAIMARQARPLGYLGLFSPKDCLGPCSPQLLAPTRILAIGYVAAYLILRLAAVWTMGVWGLRDDLSGAIGGWYRFGICSLSSSGSIASSGTGFAGKAWNIAWRAAG